MSLCSSLILINLLDLLLLSLLLLLFLVNAVYSVLALTVLDRELIPSRRIPCVICELGNSVKDT